MKASLYRKFLAGSALGLTLSMGTGNLFAQEPPNVLGSSHSVIRTAARPTTPLADPGEELTDAELVTERYPDGAVKSQRWVTLDADGNFVNHGSFKAYLKNGQLMGTGEYRAGKEHGKWVRYVDRGEGTFLAQGLDSGFQAPFVSEATLVDGKLHGTWVCRDKAGRLILQWQFDNGIRTGVSTWYYSSGEKRAEVNYKNGQMNGKFLVWGPDHREQVKALYFEGQQLTTKVDWHSQGRKAAEGSYLAAPGSIESHYDWWNLTVQTTPAPQDSVLGVKHGKWNYWHPNGKLKMQGEYRDDLPVGKFTWWYENGQKQAEGDYTNTGLQSGEWIGWHPNGMKKYKGQYSSGQQVGTWMVWKPDGRRSEVHDYGQGGRPALQQAEQPGTTLDDLSDFGMQEVPAAPEAIQEEIAREHGPMLK